MLGLIGNFGAHRSCARYVQDDAQTTQADAKYVIELSSELVKKLIDLFYSAKSWKPSVTLYIYKDIWIL